MTSCACLGEHLESFAAGALPQAEAEAVRAHLQVCQTCTREVAWLRTEARLFRERASAGAPSLQRMGALRRQVLAELPRAQHRSRRRQTLRGMLQTIGSVGAAAALAFVVSHARLPSAPSFAEFEGSSCVSMDFPGFCEAPSTDVEMIAVVESTFDACLLATPGTLPYWNQCLQ